MKNKVLALVALGAFLVPGITFAQAMSTPTASTASLYAQLQALLAEVAQLKAQLAAQGGTTPAWCHAFDTNLSIGMSGSEVNALQTALGKAGETISVTGTFDDQTAAAVTAFQEQNASTILAPYGLSYGTGYAGKSTRTKLNQLFGCGNGSPVTAPISTPTTTPTSTPSSSLPITGTTPPSSNPTFTASPVSINGQGETTFSWNIPSGWSSQNTALLTIGCVNGVTIFDITNGNLFACGSTGKSVPLSGSDVIEFSTTLGSPVQMPARLTYSAVGSLGATVSLAAPVTVSPLSGNTVNVLSPVGGERWPQGSTQTITWSDSAATATSTYTIYIVQQNGNSYGIAGTAIGTTQLRWTVGLLANGSNLSVGSNYYVQVVKQYGAAGTVNFAQSPAPFSITAPAAAAASVPAITAIIPTSGSAGSTVTINGSNLESTNGGPTVKFYASNGSLAGTLYFISMTSIAQQSIVFPLNMVTPVLPAGTYQVAVTTSAGTSNTLPFTVTGNSAGTPAPAVPQLSVTVDPSSPSAGTIAMGSTGDLLGAFRFTPSGSENIKITALTIDDSATAATTSVPLASFANLSIWSGSTLLGTANAPTVVSDKNGSAVYAYTFNFTNPIGAMLGSSLVLTVKGDAGSSLTGSATAGSQHQFFIPTTGAVTAIGINSNQAANVTVTNAFTNIQTLSGVLNSVPIANPVMPTQPVNSLQLQGADAQQSLQSLLNALQAYLQSL